MRTFFCVKISRTVLFFILWKLMMLHLLKMLKRWDRDRKFYEEVIWKEWNEQSLWYSGYDDDWEVLVTGTRWIISWTAPLTVKIHSWVLRPVLCLRAVYTRCSLAPTRWTRLPRSMTSWGHQTPLFLTSWRGEHTNSLCLLFSNISVWSYSHCNASRSQLFCFGKNMAVALIFLYHLR